jgi:hypothetical protein
MKTACDNSLRWLRVLWKRFRVKPGACDESKRPVAGIKPKPGKRRNRHGAFFELP